MPHARLPTDTPLANASPVETPPAAARFSLRGVLLAMAIASYFLWPIGWLGPKYWASLVISCLVLGVGLACSYRKWWAAASLACPVLPVAAVFVSNGMLYPLAFWHGLATTGVVLATLPVRDRRRLRAVLCLLVMAALYGWGFAEAAGRVREIETLREAYPAVSLADRLPPAAPDPGELQLSTDVGERLLRWEETYAREYVPRERALWLLHTRATHYFVSAFGFGVSRMPIVAEGLDNDDLAADPRRDEPPAYYLNAEATPDSASELTRRLHYDFFDRGAKGYVDDRDHVAGFEPHAIRSPAPGVLFSLPLEYTAWRIERLQLVGLLRHDEPVVYEIEGVPAMDQVPGAAWRPLDDFERAALPKLVAETDVEFLETDEGAVRMLGAIRAADQCLSCHKAERGQLLGAFSYDARRVEENRASVSSINTSE